MRRALALFLALGAAATAASAGVVHVHASISYVKRDGSYEKAHLRITRDGVVVLEATIKRLLRGDTLLRLFVRDLDADAEPEVVLNLYTGGAHCCVQSVVYRYRADLHRYRSALHDWGNVGYRIVELDPGGGPELRSVDDRFAYVFTFFAASRFPVRIWRFDHGRFLDVTREFPAVVAGDAAGLWRTYLSLRRRHFDVRGALAAWLADMYLLRREDEGWAKVELARRRGELGPRDDLAGWPQGQAYLSSLKAYLRKLGYAR